MTRSCGPARRGSDESCEGGERERERGESTLLRSIEEHDRVNSRDILNRKHGGDRIYRQVRTAH